MRKLLALSAIAFGATSTAQAEISVNKSEGPVKHNWRNMVKYCESRGAPESRMWYTNTGNGFYFGPQFTEDTWHAYGGGPVSEMGDKGGRPMRSYSISYIIGVAERTLHGQGLLAWPNCYQYLFSSGL